HPPGPARHEHDGGQRLHLVAGDFGARELVAHLRTIAVHEHDVPAGGGEIDDRRETRASVAELITDRRPLARRGDRISSEGDYDSSWGRHGGATSRRRWIGASSTLSARQSRPNT